MGGIQALLVGLMVVVIYLIYRVNRLERLLEGRASGRRIVTRSGGGNGKVIPILKEQIEPGPFKPSQKEQDE